MLTVACAATSNLRIDIHLFSSAHSSGSRRRRSSPLPSRPTWPSGSPCSPRCSPSSPLAPSWPSSVWGPGEGTGSGRTGGYFRKEVRKLFKQDKN